MNGHKSKQIHRKVLQHKRNVQRQLLETIYKLPFRHRLRFAWKVVKGKRRKK
jgi:hypothetical protein